MKLVISISMDAIIFEEDHFADIDFRMIEQDHLP
jgi:hypothetical protein